MIEALGEANIRESYLFHGTRKKFIGGIVKNNFDWRLGGTNGSRFGQGTVWKNVAIFLNIQDVLFLSPQTCVL